MQPVTLAAFNELEREEQSLYVRAIFEHAAMHAYKYNSAEFDAQSELILDGDKEKQTCAFVYNLESKTYLFIGDETTLSILSLYNETLFNPQNRFELCENVFATQISTDIIFRYTTSGVAQKLPGLELLLEESAWRKKPDALIYKKGEPQLVFRSLGYYRETINELKLVTPAYFACDANTVITEQLINYKNFNQNSQLTFPASEGRGAVFSYKGIPYHRYNSNRGNDMLCQNMGLFSIDDSKHLWFINKLPEYSTVSCSFPKEYPSYTCFPSIKSRLLTDDYHIVLMMPLSRYILASLQYQRSLSVSDRIKNEEKKQATDTELDNAISSIKNDISSDKTADDEQHIWSRPSNSLSR